MLLIFISRVARQGFDCQRGPRKSLPAFWGALQFVGIVVNNTFLVSAPSPKRHRRRRGAPPHGHQSDTSLL